MVRPFFWRGAGGDLTGLTPKLYLLPPLPTCLPWPIPSFWCKATEETLDKVMPRIFGFALFLQSKLLSKLADCISPNYQMPTPSTLHQGGSALVLGSARIPATHSPRHCVRTVKGKEVTCVSMAQDLTQEERILMSN